MIESIAEVAAEFDVFPLGEVELLRKRKIELLIPGIRIVLRPALAIAPWPAVMYLALGLVAR